MTTVSQWRNYGHVLVATPLEAVVAPLPFFIPGGSTMTGVGLGNTPGMWGPNSPGAPFGPGRSVIWFVAGRR